MSDEGSDDEMYSASSSKTIYKRTRSRTSSATTWDPNYGPFPKDLTRSDSDSYLTSVKKWAVDYNNKNYIRAQCNKNQGTHRKMQGRPLDWHIEYDNSHFTRCKVNDHKGLHRKIPEIKRKHVPDNDDLADATGWEFDYGPEFNQVEQDVTYIPQGRVITRGCYRWYGVKRNDSDCDVKVKEHRQNLLNEQLVKELKCGQEFLQSDRPHLIEEENKREGMIDRRHSKGGYRHYEVERNAYDITPDELASVTHDPEWKRKYHSNGFRYLDLDMCKDEWLPEEERYSEYQVRDNLDLDDHQYSPKQGKPFRRTVLNKVYELVKREDPKKWSARHRTQLSFIPGEGDKTVYEGVPDQYGFKDKEASGVHNVYKKSSERQKYKSSRGGSGSEEYEAENTIRSYRKLAPEYEERLHRMAADKRGGRRSSYDEEDILESGRSEEFSYNVKSDNTNSRRTHKEPYSHYSGKEKRREDTYRNDDYPRRDSYVEKKSKDVYFGDSHLHRSKRKSWTTQDHEYANHHKQSTSKNTRSNVDDDDFKNLNQERDKASKSLPPHVKERMKNIREKMQRKIEHVDQKHKKKDKQVFRSDSDDGIDLIKHKGHPKDWGHSHNSGYEKYVSKNGSEIWLKKEDEYSELHHHKGH